MPIVVRLDSMRLNGGRENAIDLLHRSQHCSRLEARKIDNDGIDSPERLTNPLEFQGLFEFTIDVIASTESSA